MGRLETEGFVFQVLQERQRLGACVKYRLHVYMNLPGQERMYRRKCRNP